MHQTLAVVLTLSRTTRTRTRAPCGGGTGSAQLEGHTGATGTASESDFLLSGNVNLKQTSESSFEAAA